MALDVLIVDDSAAIRKILRRVLQTAEVRLGKVYEASDGQEALVSLERSEVDLILTDINMPNMDGIEFLRQVKANSTWSDTPVLAITTEGSRSKVLETAALGVAGYVKKPFTAEQIKEKLVGLY